MNSIIAVAQVVVTELVRRKDFYVLFVLTALLTFMMGSITVFHDDRTIRYVKELSLLLIWISSLVIAITTAARQIPAERDSRTIYPLLAKPVTRTQVLLGKFAGCWLACLITLAVFYAFFGVVAMSREHHWPLANYFQAMGLHWMMLGVVVALALLGSLIFSAPSANITISFVAVAFILFLGRHLDKVAAQVPEPWRDMLLALYYVMPHLEFFDLRDLVIHNWPAVRWVVCLKAGLYSAAYTALFLTAACLIFRRKSLS